MSTELTAAKKKQHMYWLAVLGGTTVLVAGGLAYMYTHKKAHWVAVPDMTVKPGGQYRLSFTGLPPDLASIGPATAVAGIPADWPADDLDPSRNRFEFTAPAGVVPGAFAVIPPVFAAKVYQYVA